MLFVVLDPMAYCLLGHRPTVSLGFIYSEDGSWPANSDVVLRKATRTNFLLQGSICVYIRCRVHGT